MNNTGAVFLYLICITLAFILAGIATFKRKPSSQNAGILLSLLFWTFFYGATVGYLNASGNVIYAPHLFRTAHIAMVLYMPLSYLYIIQAVSPRKFRYKDLIHILPVALYVVDYFSFFLKSGDEKIAIFQSLDLRHRHIYFSEGSFMPALSHIIIRYFLMVIYWIAQFQIIRKLTSGPGSTFQKANPNLIVWFKWLIGSEILIFIPPLLTILLKMEDASVIVVQVCALTAICIQGYFLFSHPEILYGIKGIVVVKQEDQSAIPWNEDHVEEPGEELLPLRQPVQYLSENTLNQIELQLANYMHTKKPYLEKQYSLSDLARETHFTTHQISGYINKRCEMNFYSYINQFRIEYCKQKISTKEYLDKTLEAIAGESGFQSRATFIRAFKKNTGLTPSEYIKNLPV